MNHSMKEGLLMAIALGLALAAAEALTHHNSAVQNPLPSADLVDPIPNHAAASPQVGS
jgi:hypothetical protein